MRKRLFNRYEMPHAKITVGMFEGGMWIQLDAKLKGPLTKEILRKMLVDCVEEFLAAVNSDEKLRPFLKNYPYTPKAIEVTFIIKDENSKKLDESEINVASARDGIIFFSTIDFYGFEDVDDIKWEQEDYQTALKIVNTEKKSNSSDTLMICNGAGAPLQIMRVSE